MGVLVIRHAVRGPTRVTQADRSLGRLPFQFGCQVVNPAGRFRDGKLTIVNRHNATAVVTAVLQTPQTLDQKTNGLVGTDITNNAAHGRLGLECKKERLAGLDRPNDSNSTPAGSLLQLSSA